MRDENPTVYSTEHGRMCPKCGKPLEKCICKAGKPPVKTVDGVVRLFRESKGRKGKTVTLIKGLPGGDDVQREILSDLKRLCGSGGSIKEGVLEIQGDHRDLILAELKKRGLSAKIAGG
jgi:translation initiation factor 1